MGIISINIVLLLFASLMIWGATTDIKNYTLSNKLCLSVLCLYMLFLLILYLNGMPLSFEYVLYSIAISIGIFIVLALLFALNLIGGGDVKFIPVVALWAGPSLTIKFLLITTICGGIVSLSIIGYSLVRRIIFQPKSSENVNHFVSDSPEYKKEEKHIPYGVAIAAGGLFIAYDLHLALG